MGRVLHEWPELKEVRFDLSALAVLDQASVASLQRAIDTTLAAGILLRVERYDARMARLMVARGIGVEHLGAPREPDVVPARTLH